MIFSNKSNHHRVAALFLGIIAFNYKPDIQAQVGIMGGGSEMIIPATGGTFVHMKDGKLRFCGYHADRSTIRYIA